MSVCAHLRYNGQHSYISLVLVVNLSVWLHNYVYENNIMNVYALHNVRVGVKYMPRSVQ